MTDAAKTIYAPADSTDWDTSVGTVDTALDELADRTNALETTVPAHASRHERAGADEIDGDHLDIDYTPSGYTPDTTPFEADNVDDLAAHLAGISNKLVDALLETVVDAQGDLLVGTSADTVARLAIGSDGEILEADSGESAGMKWAAKPASHFATSAANASVAGGASAFVPIAGGANLTEANCDIYVSTAMTLKNLRTYVSSNGSSAGGNTITIRKNGSSTSLQTTYAASTAGAAADTSNTVTLAAGDRFAVRATHAGAGFDGAFVVQSWCVEAVIS